jgi:hypothetical protein
LKKFYTYCIISTALEKKENDMLSGIYVMYFENIFNKFYVGYSINLELRKSQHFNRLKNGTHSNHKLQHAYNVSGSLPIFEILELTVSDPTVLGKKEIGWIKEFDAYTDGFNNSNGGEGGGFGEAHYNALYTEEVYVKIAKYLINYPDRSNVQISKDLDVSPHVVNTISSVSAHAYLVEKVPGLLLGLENRKLPVYCKNRKHDTEVYISILKDLAYTYDKLYTIAARYNVSDTIVEEISAGTTHAWLKDEYPEEWAIILEKKKSRRYTSHSGKAYPPVISPEGILYNIDTNAKAFAIANNLQPGHFGDLLRGKIKQHKGWKLA